MAPVRPVHEIRVGRVRVAIWANRAQNQEVWFSVTVTRRYHDGQAWKDAASFGRDDLPMVSKAIDLAYAWIWGQDVSAQPDPASET